MGEVYRALDTGLQREVAIKVLPDAVAGDADRLMRFEREARVLAALNHPHIAHIYGLEEFAGGGGAQHALIMELVEGDTLADRLARGALPLDESLAIARQITDALHASHDAGVVHRDLKPANVKVRSDGTVKVLDFGLAKLTEAPNNDGQPASMSPTITSPAMTRAGLILGTAAYMSPEQARGTVIDRRTDVWAFGCVLFEMLTGRLAFPGDTISDTIAAILAREPDYGQLPANTPAAVNRVLRRCLSRDPRARLHHIADARLDLDEAQSGSSVSAAVAGAPRPG
jgi:serine/threonine protein kinase